jgi:hypothetical protein
MPLHNLKEVEQSKAVQLCTKPCTTTTPIGVWGWAVQNGWAESRLCRS